MSTQSDIRPADPELEHDEPKVKHIVVEKYSKSSEKTRASVTAAYIEGTPVEALCGAVFVPSRDPNRYPLCSRCENVAKLLGWKLP